MVRTQVIAETEKISFQVPEDYIGKVLEIIAFAKDEGLNNDVAQKKQPRFTIFHLDQDFKFNRDEANER